MMHIEPQRGFTLLIAVILSTVVLSVGLALLDVAYKQVVLSSTAKQSQQAFYNADTALECALYYDQKVNAFDFTNPASSNSITCSSTPITNYSTTADATKRVTIFTIPCPTSGIYATTTIYKYSNNSTSIYANGFNTCLATDPRRIERGLKVTYGIALSAPASGNVSYLVVAGGGGGGTAGAAGTGGGAGGGAGGVLAGSTNLTSGIYTITVGAAGSGAPNNASNGLNGGNSSFGALATAIGGGGGGSNGVGGGSDGGSGGGQNSGGGGSVGHGVNGQGNSGGAGTGSGLGGGGGGATSAGQSGGSGTGPTDGMGGAGFASSISGSSIVYGGGGGGGAGSLSGANAGAAGDSSAGAGAKGGSGANAPANRGGGGGGSSDVARGGNGGSGVVILSFPTGSLGAVSASGSYTKTVVGGNDIYRFTGNGTFTVP